MLLAVTKTNLSKMLETLESKYWSDLVVGDVVARPAFQIILYAKVNHDKTSEFQMLDLEGRVFKLICSPETKVRVL